MKKTLLFLVVALATAAAIGFAALSGTVNIAGSTSVQPLTEELAQAFMKQNSGVKIFVQGGGSGAGIKSAMTGTADIGASSRELTSDEKGLLHETVIARDGIAIVVNKANPVSNLTLAQLQKIYTGEYTNWNQVGGPNMKIVVVNREAGSGTRGAFEELVLGKLTNTSNSLVQASTGAAQQTVAITKEAIAYISLGSLNTQTVKALNIDGVACSEATIKAGSYKIQRPFILLTKSQPTGLVKAFLDYILSPEGQKIVAQDFLTVK